MAKQFNIPYTETRFYELTVEAESKEHAIERFDAMCKVSKSETTEKSFFLNSEINLDEDMVEQMQCSECERLHGPIQAKHVQCTH